MLTLVGAATANLEVKHSRFTAQAAPVATADEAHRFIRSVAVPDATHNCWAWRVGSDYRSSDDGEPAGTAGRPILAAIDGAGLDHVAVNVTRWYGGINLGAGGLVRAYGGCAAACLREAAKVQRVALAEVEVAFEFADTGAVHAVLAGLQARRLTERFQADGVHLRIELPTDRLGSLKERLRDATRNRVRLLEPTDA